MQVLDERGRYEKGEGKGVVRDIITNFWQDCFTSLMVGSSEKIPFIRHDLQKKEWEAVARVLVYGYQNLSYFPLKLSWTFIITCLFGEESITTESLLASFGKYIASEDREVLLYIQIIQYYFFKSSNILFQFRHVVLASCFPAANQNAFHRGVCLSICYGLV